MSKWNVHDFSDTTPMYTDYSCDSNLCSSRNHLNFHKKIYLLHQIICPNTWLWVLGIDLLSLRMTNMMSSWWLSFSRTTFQKLFMYFLHHLRGWFTKVGISTLDLHEVFHSLDETNDIIVFLFLTTKSNNQTKASSFFIL